MTKRMGNTGREMVESGAWAKVGRKHYQHISGVEIVYNCNRWVWEIVGKPEGWSMLWVARQMAEREAP